MLKATYCLINTSHGIRTHSGISNIYPMSDIHRKWRYPCDKKKMVILPKFMVFWFFFNFPHDHLEQ